MPPRSEQEREIPPFSRSLMAQDSQFSGGQFRRSNQTHEEPDCELRLKSKIAFQNLLTDIVVRSGKSHMTWPGRQDHFLCVLPSWGICLDIPFYRTLLRSYVRGPSGFYHGSAKCSELCQRVAKIFSSLIVVGD